jgi:uncharacterized protein
MEYMTEFTPYRGLFGGALIGLSAVLFLFMNGRIAGISGLIHDLCPPEGKFPFWRLAFLIGLLVGGFSYYLFPSIQFTLRTHYPVFLLFFGGVLVGFGTRMGSGCTSGHGVCGMARLSKRSIVATITFMLTAIITVAILRHGLGVA